MSRAFDERRILDTARARDSQRLVDALADYAKHYPKTWPDLLCTLVALQDDATRLWIMGHVVVREGGRVTFMMSDQVPN